MYQPSISLFQFSGSTCEANKVSIAVNFMKVVYYAMVGTLNAKLFSKFSKFYSSFGFFFN